MKARTATAVAVLVLAAGAALLLRWRAGPAPSGPAGAAATRVRDADHAAPSADSAARPEGVDRRAEGRRPSSAVAGPAPSGGPREEPWTTERWQGVPLDGGYGGSLGDEAVASFNDTLGESMDASGCADRWKPPDGTKRYEARWEVRLVPDEAGYVVDDVRVFDATLSDEDFESCVRAAWVGRHVPVSEGTPGRSAGRARILFPMVLHYGWRPPDR